VPSRDAELLVGVLQVVLDSSGRQEEPLGDFTIGQALSGQNGDLPLAPGESDADGWRRDDRCPGALTA
jgi:hypothetical protein